ncbi:MAG TPA: serine/threonine-protein kinase [Kofleriaceae bacterium]|jgi:serine/threonine protein kinase|nr:serine/threonine-protein kinase [Kofleriaceae bacterium]
MGGDPRRITDVVLAAAVRAQADAVFLDPSERDDTYTLTLERASKPIATQTLEAGLGAAVIARLAFLADLDFSTPASTSAVVPVRAGNREAEAVITVRSGGQLRADVMLMPRRRERGTPLEHVDPEPGETVGRYRVMELLGKGGMGTVYKVEHLDLGRLYALKVLRSRVLARDATAGQRFLKEARTAARIHHPNIVDVVDLGYLPDGRPYLVMELLEGASLADRVERGALPVRDVLSIARQLATALAAAHDRGVIHTDVTPSNVLLVGTGEPLVKLVDFGLAVLADERTDDDDPKFILGTPAYVSPEQLRGRAPTDRSDQYGLGAVLFELVTGRPPFDHRDLRTLCQMHLSSPVPPVESPHGPLPTKLGEVIATCLQKLPEARFPSMRALLDVLDEIERISDRRGWRRWLPT